MNLTNLSYGSGKAEQLLSSFSHKPTQEDTIKKAHLGKLDTSHLVLKAIMVNGKTAHRWVDPSTGKEHAPHGSKVKFEHKGENKTGIIGTVLASGEYAIKGDDGRSYAKHSHQFEPPTDSHHPAIEGHTISKDKLEHLDEEGDDEDIDVNTKFDIIYPKYVRMVAKGYCRSGLAYGSGGIGKSFILLQTLNKTKNPKTGELFVKFDPEQHIVETDSEDNEEDENGEEREFTNKTVYNSDNYDYVVIKGKATISGVIQAMWEHNGKLLVFDDCDTALTQPDTIMMFKGALDSTEGGQISNLSAKPLKDSNGTPIPQTFKFTGRAFFISNLRGSQIDQAIKSRSLRVNLTMTPDQTLERIKKIAKDKDGGYTNIELFDTDDNLIPYESKDMEEAIKFVEKYKNKTNDLNIRTLGNIVRLIHDSREEGEDEDDWRMAAKSFILSKAVVDDLEKGGKGSGRRAKGDDISTEYGTSPKHHISTEDLSPIKKRKSKNKVEEEEDIEKAFDNLIDFELNKAFEDVLSIGEDIIVKKKDNITKAFDDILNEDLFEKGKFNKIITVNGKHGTYQRVQLVGSDKNPLSSKHHNLHQIFQETKQPNHKDLQSEYENELHGLVEHEGKYYKLEDKKGQTTGGRTTNYTPSYKGATEYNLHPDEIAYKNKLHKDKGTSSKATDVKDLKNRLTDTRYEGGVASNTKAFSVLKAREAKTKEELQSKIPKKEVPIKTKKEKPVDEAKEEREYNKFVGKSTKEINTILSGVSNKATIKDLSGIIKTKIGVKGVLTKDTPISFTDSKGEKREGEWGQFRHWVDIKSNNPAEADKKIPFKDIKIEFKLEPKDKDGWQKVNYIKKAFEDILGIDTIEKFIGGEGSRGGKVIGHTKSGKPVYDDKNTSHDIYTKSDHLEAADFHEEQKAKALKKQGDLNFKISQLPDHKLFTSEHQSLSNKENSAYQNVKKHEGARMFHLTHGLKGEEVEKAVKNELKSDEGWGNNSVVLGSTKSKKEIYNKADNPKHKEFDESDHKDAYTLHGLEAVKAHAEMGKQIEIGNKKGTDKARDKYDYHSEQYDLHRKLARESAKQVKEQETKVKVDKDKPKSTDKPETKKPMKKEEEIEKAFEDILNVDIIVKANKGEGSRGGKIIGHTKSNKPIYLGSIVKHPKHGIGKVSSSNIDGHVSVDFDDDLLTKFGGGSKPVKANSLELHTKPAEKRLRYDSESGKMVPEHEYKIDKPDKEGFSKVHYKESLEKAEFDTKERKKLSKEGEAERDGSYPIRNASDLANAIKALGRSKDPAKTKEWIKKRAKELGKENMLPGSWKKKVEKCDKDIDLIKALQNLSL